MNEKLRAMLGFLEKLTLFPEKIEVNDVKSLQDIGLSDSAIKSAIYVCFTFSIITRLADAFDFSLPTNPKRLYGVSQTLARFGYVFLSLPG